jgi:ribosomal protein S18 acetylase RimI-like enzyme
MQETDGAIFFASSEDLPIGIAALFRSHDQAGIGELMQVWVSPDYRGSRVARDLMDAVFAWAQASDYQTVMAGVTRVNARAITFYIKYGFSIMDQPAQTDSESIYFMKVVR